MFLSKILKPREENEWKQKPCDRELQQVSKYRNVISEAFQVPCPRHCQYSCSWQC